VVWNLSFHFAQKLIFQLVLQTHCTDPSPSAKAVAHLTTAAACIKLQCVLFLKINILFIVVRLHVQMLFECTCTTIKGLFGEVDVYNCLPH
jgi:hypothetical protein